MGPVCHERVARRDLFGLARARDLQNDQSAAHVESAGHHDAPLAEELAEPTPVRGEPVVTPIVSVAVGDDALAVRWWHELFDRGVFTSAAMHPAVPPRRALLRLCVMATHTREQLDRTVDAFAEVQAELERGG